MKNKLLVRNSSHALNSEPFNDQTIWPNLNTEYIAIQIPTVPSHLFTYSGDSNTEQVHYLNGRHLHSCQMIWSFNVIQKPDYLSGIQMGSLQKLIKLFVKFSQIFANSCKFSEPFKFWTPKSSDIECFQYLNFLYSDPQFRSPLYYNQVCANFGIYTQRA